MTTSTSKSPIVPRNGGLIKMIIILVIALLILSYFGFNLQNIVNSPTTQSNFSYVWNQLVSLWDNYLQVPATYLWDLFVQYVWNPAINNLAHVNLQSAIQPPATTTSI